MEYGSTVGGTVYQRTRSQQFSSETLDHHLDLSRAEGYGAYGSKLLSYPTPPLRLLPPKLELMEASDDTSSAAAELTALAA